MKFSKKISATLAVLLCMVMLIAGCASGGKTGTTGSLELGESKYGTEYPIKTDKTLTVWTNRKPDPAYLTFEEEPIFQEFAKRTGINAKWTFPSGTPAEAFNLLMASGQYPDIIINTWLGSSYNPADAIREGIIHPTDEIIKAYAPNYQAFLDANPEFVKYVKTDDGQQFAFANASNKSTAPFLGPIVRADLMEKLNLEDPETIDDWTAMLKAFKADGVEAPLTFVGNMMTDVRFAPFIFGAYETAFGYYLNDAGEVKYGPLEAEFKQALELLRSWYEEGLLDKEFVSIDDTTIGQKMLDGRAAITDYFLSLILTWKNSAAQSGSGFSYRALPYPTQARGEKPEFGHMPEAYSVSGAYEFAAISTQSQDVELAAKYIDYWFSEEGAMLCNFGIEGTTYKMENGEIELLEPFKSDFNKLTPYIKDWVTKGDTRFAELRYTDPDQLKARSETWVTNMVEHTMPTILPSQEESAELNSLVTAINDYANEQVLKFIIGNESMENYDAFVEELKRLGVERVLEIKTNQMERFNNR